MDGTEHISLLGLMGSGKSTVGERLARSLRRQFIDLDMMIIARHGPISKLFAQVGEEMFRKYEEEVLTQATTGTAKVISTGGGAVTYEPSRRRLTQTVRIYLNVPIKTLVRRLAHSSTIRPLVGSKPTLERIHELWEERHQWYEEAEIHVNGDAPVDHVVQQILRQLQQRGIMPE